MYRLAPALVAALLSQAAWGQAPSYSATSIVNASNFVNGPFAPGSLVSIFGTNLAFSTQTLATDNIAVSTLPTQLANVVVYVDNQPAPLLFASPGQINFLIPSTDVAGASSVRVTRQSVTGPTVNVTVVDSAPALFPNSEGFALATDYNNSNAVVNSGAPAKPNDLIVLYVTGLGRTSPAFDPGQIPSNAASIVNLNSLQVLLDGKSRPHIASSTSRRSHARLRRSLSDQLLPSRRLRPQSRNSHLRSRTNQFDGTQAQRPDSPGS